MNNVLNRKSDSTSGIYKITNKINNKFYIGSTINLYCRYYNHLKDLIKNTHCNEYLQRSFNKYGNDSFTFEIIATCPKEYLLKLEQWFINNLKPNYNICKKAGNSLGYKHSEKTKSKMKLNRIKYFKLNKVSDETKFKQSQSRKKPVLKLDMFNNIIEEYSSIKEANLAHNVKTMDGSISKVCKGKLKTRHGFRWKYK